MVKRASIAILLTRGMDMVIESINGPMLKILGGKKRRGAGEEKKKRWRRLHPNWKVSRMGNRKQLPVRRSALTRCY